VYYVYGFMLLVFLIMMVVTACVTVVGTYFLLNAENYHWWAGGGEQEAAGGSFAPGGGRLPGARRWWLLGARLGGDAAGRPARARAVGPPATRPRARLPSPPHQAVDVLWHGLLHVLLRVPLRGAPPPARVGG
jgi:hypothetical protein